MARCGRMHRPCQQRSFRVVAHAATLEKSTSSSVVPPNGASDETYLNKRIDDVSRAFPGVLSMDDFLMRTEMALSAHNFRGDNCMAMCNVCRDEATGYFKSRVDKVFGPSFNLNGLGACLTCGRLGLKAGLSHGPIQDDKERYVFFSFPHIAIAPRGKIGGVARPGREAESTACGAMIATLGSFQDDPKQLDGFKEGEHEPTDIELTILKQRLAARIAQEGEDVKKMDLVGLTNLAERAFTEDLEAMISETIDTNKIDYAVVTGVQVHNWAEPGSNEPSMEFIVPRKFYVVSNGDRTDVNVSAVPALSPRQLALLQNRTLPEGAAVAAALGTTTVIGLDQPFTPTVQHESD